MVHRTVYSRHKTQKENISGPGSYTSGKHDFWKSGTNLEKNWLPDVSIHGELKFPIDRSFRVFEFSKRARHQSIWRPTIHSPRTRQMRHTHTPYTNAFPRSTYIISEGREWGVGSVVVDFRVFGAPRFSVRAPKPFKISIWGLWTENRGAPKTRKSTTTDPTPHFRPSDCCCVKIEAH